MKNCKAVLLATAAVAILGTGMAKPAQAFDKVYWTWNNKVTEKVNENVNVNVNISPSGLTQLEKKQVQIGNLSAKSEVSHIANNPPGITSAVDLPAVVSAGTAVGNNQSIDSNVSLNLDDSQFLKGNVSATSEVAHILNASVDSAATAVGNNTDVTLAEATPGDALLIADVKQTSIGNISAKSEVSHVDVSGYTSLAAINKPLVNSNATAVGNNFSVKVSPPAL